MTVFNQIGFSKDYYHNGKYIGSERVQDQDRTEFGYAGRKTEVLSETKVFRNKKKIKAGETVVTELFPLNGRIINK